MTKRVILIENCNECKDYDDYYHRCRLNNKDLDENMVEGVGEFCPLEVYDNQKIHPTKRG